MGTAARGCGVREPGGIYVETVFRETGVGAKINDFLIDPPRRVPTHMNLPNRGVGIFERDSKEGIFDIYDRVGESSYPNVADFIFETGKLGLSRRIPSNVDFSLLSDESIIFLAHPRAWIKNAVFLYGHLAEEMQIYKNHPSWRCICAKDNHRRLADLVTAGSPTCATLWFETITGGDPSYDPDHYPRTVYRQIGDLKPYVARQKPEGFAPEYEDALFMRLPIHRLTVIRDPEEGRDEEALERASEAKLPVVLEDA